MNVQTINNVNDLQQGEQVLVSGQPDVAIYRDAWVGPGVPGVVIAKRISYSDGPYVYILLDKPQPNGKTFDLLSAEGKDAVIRAQGNKLHHLQHEKRWMNLGRAVAVRVLRDPNWLSPEAASGLHTCKCGFINKDISISAIVNGKYLCRQCRLIWVK